MNKNKILALLLCVLAISIACSSYYYYNYQYVEEKLTDWVVITYTPPVQKKGFLGMKTSEPKIKYGKLKQCKTVDFDIVRISDSISKELSRSRNNYEKEIESLLKTKPKSDEDNLTRDIKIGVLKELIYEEKFIVAITHTRSFDPVEFLKFLKENWPHKEIIMDYCTQNKLDFQTAECD